MSGGGCERHIQRIFALAGIVADGSMTVKEMSTIHAMVAEHLGVSMIPRLSVIPGGACRVITTKTTSFPLDRHDSRSGLYHDTRDGGLGCAD
jgi:DNA-binding transcriptional LysR family regulator